MRLTKRDVETMLDHYDVDPIEALTTALRVVLDEPHANWQALVTHGPFDDNQKVALAARRQGDLDDLLTELNELRTLRPLQDSSGR